jgi:hypothetical protein
MMETTSRGTTGVAPLSSSHASLTHELAEAKLDLSRAVSALLCADVPTTARRTFFAEQVRELMSRLDRVRALEHELGVEPAAGGVW